jgi:hypothetical protein
MLLYLVKDVHLSDVFFCDELIRRRREALTRLAYNLQYFTLFLTKNLSPNRYEREQH